MQGASYSYYNPNQNASIPPWCPPTHPSWSTPSPWSFAPQYHSQPANQPFQPYAPPQPQWNTPSQGWRPPYNQSPALLPPPPSQPQLLHPAPPKQPQMPAQPNLNPNNRQAQQVYSGETSYPAYVVEIQEINLRSGRVLPDNQPPSPPEELEEEKEESVPQANPPPFPERLIHPSPAHPRRD
jgi:hypothetical protein